MEKSGFIQYHALFIRILVVALLIWIFVPKGLDVIWINSFHQPYLDVFFKYVTYLGDGRFFAVFAAFTLFFNYRWTLFLAFSGGVQMLLSALFKRVFDLNRPILFIKDYALHLVEGVEIHQHHSFPSGHSITVFAMTSFLSMVIKPTTISHSILLCIAWIGAISRVYLCQHFWGDVVAGAAIGTFIVWALWFILKEKSFFKGYFPFA